MSWILGHMIKYILEKVQDFLVSRKSHGKKEEKPLWLLAFRHIRLRKSKGVYYGLAKSFLDLILSIFTEFRPETIFRIFFTQ